jgi:RING-variant domain
MEEKICRYCLENETKEEKKLETLIAPCACKGTHKWVHRSCLDKWRITVALDPFHDHFFQCEICHKKFQFEKIDIHRTTWEKIYPFLRTLIEFFVFCAIFSWTCYGIGLWIVRSYHPSFLGDIDENLSIWVYGSLFVHMAIGAFVIIFVVCIFGGSTYTWITGDTEMNNCRGVVFFIVVFTIGAMIFLVSTIIFFCVLLYNRYTSHAHMRDVNYFIVKDLSRNVELENVVVNPGNPGTYHQMP